MFHATGLPGWMRAAAGGVTPESAPAAEAEDQVPQSEVEALRSQLDEVKKRLAELEAARAEN